MKLIGLSLLLIVAALEEPEPINEEERNDEIAQAMNRAKLVACLSLVRSKVLDNGDWAETTIKQSKHDPAKTKQKIVADLLYVCHSEITYEQAELVLSEDFVDITKPKWAGLLKIDEQQFSDPAANLDLKPEQQALVDYIKAEMTKKDDGFEQEPPSVEGFNPADYIAGSSTVAQWLLLAGTAVGGLLIVFVLGLAVKRLFKSPPKPKEKSKKKRH